MSANEKTISYMDLGPSDSDDLNKVAVDALKWGIQNKNVTNIAVAGPYGSGKSSIIKAFLRRYPEEEEKSVAISLADYSFVQSENASKLEPDEVETGILKQLIYSAKIKEIPHSTLRIDRKKYFKKTVGIIIAVEFVLLLLLLLLFPQKAFETVSYGIELVQSKVLYYSAVAITILVIGFLITVIWYIIPGKIMLKKAVLPANTSIEFKSNHDRNQEESVLDRNIDELVYYFSNTDCRIVFFEDLDRLNDATIFVRLKSINTLINNSKEVEKKVTFVYAVRDDLFDSESRTKFFEFIIPVIPVINSTNSSDKMIELLEGLDDINVSKEYIFNVSPFIDDMRVLYNIVNDFLMYKHTLGTGDDELLPDEKMLSLCVFKNLFPADFAEIEKERGVIKQAFEDKRLFIKRKIEENKTIMCDRKNMLSKMQNELLLDVKGLKAAFFSGLGESSNGLVSEIIVENQEKSGNRQTFPRSTIMDEGFDFSKLNNHTVVKYVEYSFPNGISNTYNCNDDTICSTYYERWKVLNDRETNKAVDYQEETERLQKDNDHLQTSTISDLIEKYGEGVVLSEEVCENTFLVFLLRKGYIDENYSNYINHFQGNSITEDDRKFILSIRNRNGLEPSFHLTRIKQLVLLLQPYEFDQKEILNYELLDYLLSSTDENEKLDKFIAQLSDGTDESWSFVDSFIDYTEHSSLFLQMLVNKWAAVWKYLSEKADLTYERKVYYLSSFCRFLTVEEIEKINIDESVSQFFLEHEYILRDVKDVDPGKIESIIDNLHLSFSNLKFDGVSPLIIENTIENLHFDINQTMINRIIIYKAPEMSDRVLTQNYTMIRTLAYRPLTIRIELEFKKYIDEIFLKTANTKESIDSIQDALTRCVDDLEYCERIIAHESFEVDGVREWIGSIVSEKGGEREDLWNILLSNLRVSPTWKNVFDYYNENGLSDVLVSYLKDTIEILSREKTDLEPDFAFDLLESDLDNSNLQTILSFIPFDYYEEDKLLELTVDRLSLIVSRKEVKYSVDLMKGFLNKDRELAISYAMNNQVEFVDSIKSIIIDKATFDMIIEDERITESTLITVIDELGIVNMDETAAKVLLRRNIPMQLTLFTKTIECFSDREDAALFMYQHLSIIDENTFEALFPVIGGEFESLMRGSGIHREFIRNTENNMRLVKRLKEVGYITSYEDQGQNIMLRVRKKATITTSIAN